MFIAKNSTAFGMLCQPHSVGYLGYRIQMPKKDPKQILWENVRALMTKRYGKENLGKFAADCGIGATSMTRIKVAKTSVRVDTIEAIAKEFKLQSWQVLVDGLIADDPPVLVGVMGTWPFSDELLDAVGKLDAAGLWYAENTLRGSLKMDPLPMPTGNRKTA